MTTTADLLPKTIQREGSDDLPEFAVSEPATSGRAPRRFPKRAVLLSLGAVVLIAGGCRWWDYSHTWETTDNAVIVGDTHQISTRISGTVARVLVEDNEAVRAGQPLVELDDRDMQAALAGARASVAQSKAQQIQAAAQVAAAQAAHEEAEAQLATAQAQLAQARANAVKATADFQRTNGLVQHRVLSPADYDAAKATHDATDAAVSSAEAGVRSAKSRVDSAIAQTRAAEAGESVAEATGQNAEAALRTAELQLSYTVVTAPTAGHVGRKSVQTGNRLVPGQPLMAVVEDATWVVANFKETQLAHMKPGQVVEVEVDALSGRTLSARVDSFAPASGAIFALLPPDNATGNFTKIVQRVPVKITFDSAEARDLTDRLLPGLSVVAKVNLRAPALPFYVAAKPSTAAR